MRDGEAFAHVPSNEPGVFTRRAPIGGNEAMISISLSGRALLLGLCLTVAVSGHVSAQYFGQNKVHYKDLDFHVLKTDHFDIYYYPSERSAVDVAARMAERWYARLSRVFDRQLRGRQPLIIYASSVDFRQTNVISGDIGEGTGGVTEPLPRPIVMPLGGLPPDT